MPFGVGERGGFHQQRLETVERLPRQDLETAFGLIGGINRVYCIGQGSDSRKTFRADQSGRVEPRVP